MLVLVGSRAAEIVMPGMLGRPCKDWDFIGLYDEIQEFIAQHRSMFREIYPEGNGRKIAAKGPGLICEFEIAWSDTTGRELYDFVHSDPYHSVSGPPHFQNSMFRLPSIDQLYTIKLSHRFLKDSPHFRKTMDDVRKFRQAGAQVFDEGWLKRREKETYWYKHPKLDVKKDDFFKGDGVVYTYDHDTIHVAMKHLERPAYTYFKPVDKDVLCDKKMFFDADEEVRLYSVLEEALVLALERSQIPFPGILSPRQAFEKALMKVTTSITSGWWREYAWEHHDHVLKFFLTRELDYVDRFWKAVEAGVVKKL